MNGTLDLLLGSAGPWGPLDPLVLPIAIALLGGAVAYVLAALGRGPAPAATAACKVVALAASTAVLVAALSILRLSKAAFQWTWATLGSEVSLRLDLAATPLGMVVTIGAAGFAVLITVYSFRAMAG